MKENFTIWVTDTAGQFHVQQVVNEPSFLDLNTRSHRSLGYNDYTQTKEILHNATLSTGRVDSLTNRSSSTYGRSVGIASSAFLRNLKSSTNNTFLRNCFLNTRYVWLAGVDFFVHMWLPFVVFGILIIGAHLSEFESLLLVNTRCS